MGLISNMAEFVRTKIQNFLQITPAPERSIVLNETITKEIANVIYRAWYKGDPEQLSQLYKQIDTTGTMFWAAKSTKGLEIRKIHIGLPALIIDILVNIVTTDFNGIEITSQNTTVHQDRWEEIAKENKFDKLLKKMLTDAGAVGDGAFKLSYDTELSKLPIIEWYPSEKVDFVCKRGRIVEVVFHTIYTENKKQYRFSEYYGYGYIKYKLYNEKGEEIPLNSISQTSWINGVGVQFDKSYMWAVPVRFGESSYEGRGKGLIEGKEGDFDSVDEAWSQWMDALRKGRTKEYIPECFIPVNPETLEKMTPNPFDNSFIQVGSDVKENGSGNKIYTETPEIQHESYLATYVAALDLCLQGLISPSTLGIDMKKLDNADAQREKEKATLYTRQKFIELLENVLPELVKAVLNADSQFNNKVIITNDLSIDVNFGEYANPSFESVVETVGKARQYEVMSIEQSVEEMYGDSKTEDWKAKEVQRIKEEKGIVSIPEKSELDDIPPIDSNNATAQLLNGTQITSLMSIISMIKAKEITRNEGLSIMTSTLGITRENAEKFVEEQL